MPSRQRNDQPAMKYRRRAPRHDQAAIRTLRERRDGALNLAGIAQVNWAHVYPDRRRHRLDYRELADTGGDVGIPEDQRSRYARCDFLEKFQPFPAQTVFELDETGGVAAWPRHALDEAGADRVGDSREHDRNGAGRLQQRRDRRTGLGKDDVGGERD